MTSRYDKWESPVLDGNEGGLVQFKIYLTKGDWLALSYRRTYPPLEVPFQPHRYYRPSDPHSHHRYYADDHGLVIGFQRRAELWGVDVNQDISGITLIDQVKTFSQTLMLSSSKKKPNYGTPHQNKGWQAPLRANPF